MSVRRAYCIACGKLYRRDPDTWTARRCKRCGGEVRFSGGRKLKEELVITLRLLPDDRELLGPEPIETLRRVCLEHVVRLHRRAERRGRISARPSLELEPPPASARKY